MPGTQENSGRRKTSKYFATTTATESGSKQTTKHEKVTEKSPAKRKAQTISKDFEDDVKPVPAKRFHKDEDDDDFVPSNNKKKAAEVKPSRKLKSESGGVSKKSVDKDDDDDYDEDELDNKYVETPVKAGGRGRGGRGAGAAAGGRGRGGGRGGFMNFGERKDPPHKGEKVI